jgi:hypothetical protein
MNAADVLAEVFADDEAEADARVGIAALLAHGDQGVAILPDRTLWALDLGVPEGWPLDDDEALYRLLPLSAEAGDTPCPTCKGRGCEYGCGHCHESPSVAGPDAHRQCITCHGSGVSAEAGDPQ